MLREILSNAKYVIQNVCVAGMLLHRGRMSAIFVRGGKIKLIISGFQF